MLTNYIDLAVGKSCLDAICGRSNSEFSLTKALNIHVNARPTYAGFLLSINSYD
jgi:hypothetical protein